MCGGCTLGQLRRGPGASSLLPSHSVPAKPFCAVCKEWADILKRFVLAGDLGTHCLDCARERMLPGEFARSTGPSDADRYFALMRAHDKL